MLDSHPPPDIPARPITDDDRLPRNAKALLRKADGLGLRHHASYARGTDLDTETVIDSLLVRIAGDAFCSVAAWHSCDGKPYKYATGYVWRRLRGPRRIDKTVHVKYRAFVEAIDAFVAASDTPSPEGRSSEGHSSGGDAA